MRCDEVQDLLDIFLDGEMDDVDAAEFEAHLGVCDGCCELVAKQAEFKDGLRALATEHRLDDAFHARLDALVAPCPEPARSHRTPWMAAAAAAAVLGVGAFGSARVAGPDAATPPIVAGQQVDPDVVDESVRWHSRPLPVDVTGPDGREVTDWFADKVDFPVLPPDFSRRAHLLGGRLGNVRESDAALLVYEVEGRKLSVIVYDVDQDSTPRTGFPVLVGERNGYNVAVHERDGVGYTFTTDLPEPELADLVNVAFSY